MMNESRRSVKDFLKELNDLKEASKRRQQGSNTTSDDLTKARKVREQNDGPGARGQLEPAGKPTSKPQTNNQVKYKAPKRRPTGREEMIAERYMSQRQKKERQESSIVGD